MENLASNAALVAGLEHDHGQIVAAAEAANGDDEHDPEGATIAFERQQVTALLQQARRTRADLEHALDQVDQGRYGECERCGDPIAAERLAARPAARTCLSCAT
ncbi:MAG: DNA-binding protein [Pseudonocardiales bacterium]|nr:MAG: DNA-binding protein [Pseudonocardiales bacterium]